VLEPMKLHQPWSTNWRILPQLPLLDACYSSRFAVIELLHKQKLVR
jgi:hypothetical protein